MYIATTLHIASPRITDAVIALRSGLSAALSETPGTRGDLRGVMMGSAQYAGIAVFTYPQEFEYSDQEDAQRWFETTINKAIERMETMLSGIPVHIHHLGGAAFADDGPSEESYARPHDNKVQVGDDVDAHFDALAAALGRSN